MNKKSWLDSITKIHNKDIKPETDWITLYKKVLNIFTLEKNKPNKIEIEEFINKCDINYENSKKNIETIMKVTNPGRRQSISLSDNEYNKIKNNYEVFNENNYSYEIELKYKDKSKKTLDKQRVTFKIVKKSFLNKIWNYIENTNSINIMNYLIKDLMKKIEKAAFCKGGDRRVRWELDEIHSEFGSKKDCIQIAFSLTKNYLYAIVNSKSLGPKIKKKIKKIKNIINYIKCFENKNNYKSMTEENICAFCYEKYTFINFVYNARSNDLSISMGHDKPRYSRWENNHTANNVFWIHRRCNNVQSNYTIQDSLEFVNKILKKRIND